MRRFKLIAILCFAWALVHTAHATTFFYANVAQPSSSQIIIGPDSIGGHRPAAAFICSAQEKMWCYHSDVFSLALPRNGFKSKVWTYRGFRYELGGNAKLTLLGSEVEIFEILQSRNGKRVMNFVYSPERGLISFRAAKPAAPSFISEGRCGLGAPDSCEE